MSDIKTLTIANALGSVMLPDELAKKFDDLMEQAKKLSDEAYKGGHCDYDKLAQSRRVFVPAWLLIWEAFPELEDYALTCFKSGEIHYFPKELAHFNPEDNPCQIYKRLQRQYEQEGEEQ